MFNRWSLLVAKSKLQLVAEFLCAGAAQLHPVLYQDWLALEASVGDLPWPLATIFCILHTTTSTDANTKTVGVLGSNMIRGHGAGVWVS